MRFSFLIDRRRVLPVDEALALNPPTSSTGRDSVLSMSPNHTTIAGRAAHTSWVFYSRPWNRSEEKFVEDSIAKITQDSKGAPGTMPFAHLVPKGDPSASFAADPPEDLKREVSGLEDVKCKASGEFKIRLKVLKPSDPRQPTEQAIILTPS
ncbi:uncharacterized protein PGTG_12930 [Puccinia graminis f. sp. tritici CRL 75-36-700-3]|uniref:Uncharacterized protein n=1 Tax=Puccinia graminis f. sp. tritici (strain CRL 75-36-700-3 / race SCCL) TaxID=418459 RepID=E3KQH3_PUCGT|nr:uncharacterized protein PGTG_12930 [Puccinia graminis f. sp. tritici CRL 75-36-700-3]EFP86548.2 hypothetical protein PGTG_12930 [Puccinia graminis f. sp. tritici CRL 75-36-700-3]